MEDTTDNKSLPKEWKWVKLKDISESIQYGFTESSSKDKIGPKFLRITDIQENQVDWNEVQYCKIDIKLKSKYLLKEGDLVFARTGATVGKSFLINGKIPEAVFASYLIRVRVTKEVNEKFLSNFFQSTNYWSQITEGKVGIGQPNVNGTKLGQLVLPLPPKAIQQQIVSKIEELFSELDKSVEELKTAQQQLTVYRQAVLKRAFEGRLTNHGIKEDEFPKTWKLVKIHEIAENNKHALKAGPFGSSLKKEFYVRKGYKIYGQEQVISGNAFYGDYYISKEKFNELHSNRVKAGDILISLVGTVGKVLMLPHNCQEGIINPRLIKISLNKKIYLPLFFKYYFESSIVKKLYSSKTRGTTMNVLNLGIIKTIPFPICEINEQQQVVQEIESRLSICDKIEETIQNSLNKAGALRKSILKVAFEGKFEFNTL